MRLGLRQARDFSDQIGGLGLASCCWAAVVCQLIPRLPSQIRMQHSKKWINPKTKPSIDMLGWVGGDYGYWININIPICILTHWPALGTVLWPPSISLRTAPSHQAGLFQRKVSLHRRGRNTSTGATLTVFIQYSSFTVFIQYSSWYSIYFIPQEPGERNKRRPINLITKNAYSYASTPVTIIPTLTWCPQREP